MKKILALLMTLVMALSLCACGAPAEEAPEAAAPAPEEEVTVAETAEEVVEEVVKDTQSDVQARLDAGEEVLIGYAVNTLSNPALKQTIDNVTGMLEELGFTVSVVTCEGDTALMISQVENFIEMGVDEIIVAPIDQNAMEDTLQKAIDAGIPVIFNGQYPSYADKMSGGGATDYPALGTNTANAALAWLDQAYPDAGEGKVHVAVIGFNNTFIFKQIYDAMLETIEADPRVTVTYTATEHNSIDAGYMAAEEAMTMDPEIRVFLCYQDSPGIGVANYLISQPSLNMDEFGVFNGSFSDTSTQMVDDESNPTRCIIYYGIMNSDVQAIMGYDIYYAAKSVLLGEQEAPYWILADMWSYDSFDYDLVVDHPENDSIYEAP